MLIYFIVFIFCVKELSFFFCLCLYFFFSIKLFLNGVFFFVIVLFINIFFFCIFKNKINFDWFYMLFIWNCINLCMYLIIKSNRLIFLFNEKKIW